MELRKLVAWLAKAGLAWPKLSAPPVARRRLALNFWHQGRQFSRQARFCPQGQVFQSLVVRGMVSAASRAVEARIVRVWLVTGRPVLGALH